MDQDFNIQDFIAKAYAEDIPMGDITTDSLGLSSKIGRAKLIAKQDLVLSGYEIFEQCIYYVCPDAAIKSYFKDSDYIYKGQCICEINANLLQILKAERVALNFLGYLSGIASLTYLYNQQVAHTACKILDTRKILAHYRDLVKMAVRHGGGQSHRRDLSSAILIKENHIRAADGIKNAITNIRKNYSGPIEIEVSNIEELQQAIALNVERVLLDNMNNDTLKECLSILPKHIVSEASGNMSLDRVRSVAELGIDFISVGALTHSAPVADISMLFDWDHYAGN